MLNDDRPSKPIMFMQIAAVVSQRASCRRRKVGAIITDDELLTVLAIGYNGNAKGLPNTCDSDIPGECGCIHAEVNALIKAPYHQGFLVLFSTTAPCPDCAKLILNSRVRKIYYMHEYRTLEGRLLLASEGLTIIQLSDTLCDL
jgi:dCMP deaminase